VQEDPKDPIRFILTLLDITSKKELSNKYQNPAAEKDIMMHEIHHRVKNNLQVIISMMDLELSRNNDEKLTKLLLKSKSRIRTISLIHEHLYQYDSLEKIEFSEYIRKLSSYIETLYSTINRSVTVQYTLQKIQLNISNAVPLALILNELLTNIYKHAFSNGEGSIFISFKENGDLLKLIIQDNGVGITNINKVQNPTSLGYKLINGLVNQINGNIVINNYNGTLVEINFKKELIQSSYGQSKSLLDQNN
ncbi:MAG: sensor histidine kinase, partial [Cyclobacteriaceae bacterium]|nr:sensor histidine kinase [Cyclobacteriaceae bacterium]